MSPASKSKSKDKRVAVKEPQKSSTKPTSIANTGGGVPTSGYNPLLGTFHTLETAPLSEDQSGIIEFDSLSKQWVFGQGKKITKTKNNKGSSSPDYSSTEELARIAEMEMKFKCSKQEVERAIVACEGDLEQAAETLKNQKQEQPPAALQRLKI
ncbi:UBA-like protein [Tanacetum coccineum]